MERKAVLYARVSTDEQALKGFSVAEQLHALREYAEREDLDVAEEVVDEGYSGAKESEELRREERYERAAEEDERLMLSRLEAGLPEDFEALTPAQRRGLYERLGLRVLASGDGSITLRWFVDIELGELRCQDDRTSTR